MSACSRTAWILARTRAPARTQLPFLYHTPTIQRWPAPSFARHFSRGRRPQDDDEDEAVPWEHEAIEREQRRNMPVESDIPFEDNSIPFEMDHLPSDADHPLPPTLEEVMSARKTTVTDTERQAFAKLYKKFKTQSGTNGKRRLAEEDDQVADEYYEDEDEGADTSIDAIFDEVFKTLPVAGSSGSRMDDLARKLQTEARRMSSMTAEEMEESEKFKKERRAELDRVNAMLKGAQTDIELWEVLEREVFTPIRALELDGPMDDVENEKLPSPSPGPTLSNQRKFNTSTSNPSPDPQILFRNYPHHLIFAATQLDTHFPASPLPLRLLPSIHSLGRTSFMLGATPKLYAHVLRTAWRQQHSYVLLDALLAEMDASAVEADAEVEGVLASIVREHVDARQGHFGSDAGIVMGMARFKNGLDKVRQWHERIKEAVDSGRAELGGEREKELAVRYALRLVEKRE